MDRQRELNERKELPEFLMEVLKVQELILQRIEWLEERLVWSDGR